MKLKILHFSLLFVATTAKDVYVEDAATDSPGAEAVVPAAMLGFNESANSEYYEYVEDAATDSPGAEAVDPAAKLGVNESANHRRLAAQTTVATLVVPGASTYAGCEGTYVRSSKKLWGKYTWVATAGPAKSNGRSIYYCNGKWRVGSSGDRAAYLRGENLHTCWWFISSAPTKSWVPTTEGGADWSANNGAIAVSGPVCF
jgi:hypothetical protein